MAVSHMQRQTSKRAQAVVDKVLALREQEGPSGFGEAVLMAVLACELLRAASNVLDFDMPDVEDVWEFVELAVR